MVFSSVTPQEVGSLLAGLEFDLKAEHVEITEMDGCHGDCEDARMRHLKRLSAAAEHGITADTSASVGKHTLRHGGLIIGAE
ncbi:hypothetical protein F2P79_016111 [Pimephales promelas]|nr:hypothetical protein F2P79_016111 [Pimephales promelas]